MELTVRHVGAPLATPEVVTPPVRTDINDTLMARYVGLNDSVDKDPTFLTNLVMSACSALERRLGRAVLAQRRRWYAPGVWSLPLTFRLPEPGVNMEVAELLDDGSKVLHTSKYSLRGVFAALRDSETVYPTSSRQRPVWTLELDCGWQPASMPDDLMAAIGQICQWEYQTPGDKASATRPWLKDAFMDRAMRYAVQRNNAFWRETSEQVGTV